MKPMPKGIYILVNPAFKGLVKRLGCEMNEEAQFRLVAVIRGLYDEVIGESDRASAFFSALKEKLPLDTFLVVEWLLDEAGAG